MRLLYQSRRKKKKKDFSKAWIHILDIDCTLQNYTVLCININIVIVFMISIHAVYVLGEPRQHFLCGSKLIATYAISLHECTDMQGVFQTSLLHFISELTFNQTHL